MSKHTPGPWSLRGYNLETLDFAVSATGQMVDFDIYPPMSKKHMMPIASVQHCFNGKACEANARLIAAAPDLLEALKDALNVLDATGANDAANAARAAIAKAEEA